MSDENLIENFLKAKEYLVTNKIGGYASGTYLYGNTRKYHGILLAANRNLERFNVVNRLMENLIVDGISIPLIPGIYENSIPANHDYTSLESFRLNDFPEWHYQFLQQGIRIKKSLVQETGKNKTIVRYEINSKNPGKFSCLPLLTYRSIHELKRFGRNDLYKVNEEQQDIVIALEHEKNLRISSNFPKFRKINDIYYNFYYPVEADRGYEAVEDLQALYEFVDEFPAGYTVLEIIFAFEDTEDISSAAEKNKKNFYPENFDYFAAYNKERSLLLAELPNFKASSLSKLGALLIKQAEQFILHVPPKNYPQVIAGYHWFGEWGRDTFISFPGLFLERRRFTEARQLLLAWRGLVKNGLIPNTTINLSYAALDAIFWYVVSIWQYYVKSNDSKIFADLNVNQLLDDIWQSFVNRENHVEIDNFGFLYDANNDSTMTWMDAKIDNHPVINRSGRAVEIQALWFNFLEIALRIKKIVSQDSHSEILKFTRDKLKIYFKQFFWLEKTQCLNDCLSDQPAISPDAIRLTPNQLIAVSLPFPILSKVDARKVLKFCQKNLLTDAGLKTLVKNDPRYHGSYAGNHSQRDSAYHQGTIWPFLLGLYLKAHLLNNNYNSASKIYVRGRLGRLSLLLNEKDLDYVPEIFSADTLNPGGCLSQCWSAACLLEVVYLLKNF